MFENLFKKKAVKKVYTPKREVNQKILNIKEATYDEIVTGIVSRHFKRLEGFLLDLKLPKLAYVSISKEFRFLEDELKEAIRKKENKKQDNHKELQKDVHEKCT